MKAIVINAYGPPEVLHVQEVKKPTPKDNEILIRIHAASSGPADAAFRKGDPFIVRLMFGLRRPRIKILGAELAGVVESVGKAVTAFKSGDQVFGMSSADLGCHAEYICLPENAILVMKSPEMTYEEAVAVADGSPTALTFLRETAKIQPGQKVLINGASGAVGAAAVQLAKHFGAEVTGVCSTGNAALVKSIGADSVIDYTKTDFTKTGQTFDIIFDAVGKSSFANAKRALTPTGVYLTTVPSMTIVFQMLSTMIFKSGKKARFTTAGLLQKKENFSYLKDLFDKGVLKAVIDRCYPLEQIVEMHRYIDSERKKGSVILSIVSPQ